MSYARLVLVTLGIGIAAGSAMRYALDESWGARGWPETEGRIVSSSVAAETRYISSGRGRMTRAPAYEPRIVYRYRAAGAERTGSRIWSGQAQSWDDRAGAEAVAARYPLFGDVRVRYDPEAPDQAYLIANRPSIGWILLGLFGLLLAWFGSHAKGREPRRRTPSEGAGHGA
jgi:hypothetical protein